MSYANIALSTFNFLLRMKTFHINISDDTECKVDCDKNNMDGRYYQVKDFSTTGAARTISIDLGALYRWVLVL